MVFAKKQKSGSFNFFGITIKELFLALAIAAIGFVYSSANIIIELNKLDPIKGLLASYIVIYSIFYLLSRYDLVIWKFHLKNPKNALGATLITMAFVIATSIGAPNAAYVLGGEVGKVGNLALQSPDGVFWYLWSFLLPDNPAILRILTYVLTPFVMTLVGSKLLTRIEVEPPV